MLFRLSYVRRYARLESNQHACLIRAVLSTELRAFVVVSVSWRVAGRPYASGTVFGHTARSQEDGQRREAGRGAGLRPAGATRRPGKRESLRQDLNPHFGRTKGACFPLTLRRPEWRRRESNPLLLGASEVLCHQNVPWLGRGYRFCSSVSWRGARRPAEPGFAGRARVAGQVSEVRTGGFEPPQPEASGLQPGELTLAQRPPGRGSRPGSNRHCGDHDPGCCLYTTATMHYGNDRIRTGTFSPDKRALCSVELRPQGCAAGIRTQDLELMRLARTAPPLPR